MTTFICPLANGREYQGAVSFAAFQSGQQPEGYIFAFPKDEDAGVNLNGVQIAAFKLAPDAFGQQGRHVYKNAHEGNKSPIYGYGRSQELATGMSQINCGRKCRLNGPASATGIIEANRDISAPPSLTQVDQDEFENKLLDSDGRGFLADLSLGKLCIVPYFNYDKIQRPELLEDVNVMFLKDFSIETLEDNPRKTLLVVKQDELPQLVDALFESPNEEEQRERRHEKENTVRQLVKQAYIILQVWFFLVLYLHKS